MVFYAPIVFIQTINVTVDGDVISFIGQPPVERSGMVLVPLRGVFEKLGASVFYDGPSRSIRAQKGTTEVLLRLGSTDAFVNGQRQTLALPAQTQNGTTLVPLRFVSEALGAQVSWRGASKTVVINTTGGQFRHRQP
jgi:Copper amine oxidase N-terminal domain